LPQAPEARWPENYVDSSQRNGIWRKTVIATPDVRFMSLRWRYAPASGRKEMFGAGITQALFLSAQARLGNDLG
jgi:hypothetical protein